MGNEVRKLFFLQVAWEPVYVELMFARGFGVTDLTPRSVLEFFRDPHRKAGAFEGDCPMSISRIKNQKVPAQIKRLACEGKLAA